MLHETRLSRRTRLLVHGELDSMRPRLRPEVVHACLEALFPRVEVHRRKLALRKRQRWQREESAGFRGKEGRGGR